MSGFIQEMNRGMPRNWVRRAFIAGFLSFCCSAVIADGNVGVPHSPVLFPESASSGP